MTGVHDIAERGFGRAATTYERGRPSYPAEAVELLRRELGLAPGTTVLDVGAGTGKLTRLLVPTGARVLALEPVAGMRDQLAAIVPTAELVEGTAEAIELPSESVDAVTAATAFHWFDAKRALPELHRVLRPAGVLALVWNIRDESVAWVREISRLIRQVVEETADAATIRHARRVRGSSWRAAFDGNALFTPLQEAEFRHVHKTDVATQIARFQSVSFVATLPASERAQLAAGIERVLGARADARGLVAFPYITTVSWCSAR